jgi:hypothetical protein
VLEYHWRLQVTRRGLAPLSVLLPEVASAADDLDDWLDREDIPDGVPYLISPGLEYDMDLNRYFLRPALVGASRNTQLAAARDVRRFLDFLWCARGGEQAIARGEHLLALIDQHDHGPLTGPAADEALRRLEELGEHQRLAGQVVTDPRRLQRLMKRHDPAIYPGKYVTCVYSHAKALCGGDTQPDLASCQPLRCRNVALTPGQPRHARRGDRQSGRRLDCRARAAAAPSAPASGTEAVHHGLPRQKPAGGAGMSRRNPAPDEARVREVLAQMRAEADAGATRVSVLGLARRLGMSNATFWRNYREIAIEIRQAPETPGKPARVSQQGNEAKLADRNASLRRERDTLAGQLEAALAHLRRLIMDNARLREELEAARSVSHLDTARATRKGI